MPYCASCGSPVRATDRFCTVCGRPIEPLPTEERTGSPPPVAPLAAPPAPPAPHDPAAIADGIHSLRALGIIVIVLLGLGMVVSLGLAISTALELGVIADIRDGTASAGDVDASDRRQTALAASDGLLFLATGILWLFWQHRAHRNLRLLGAGNLRFSPGWAVGWWFVPIANLWMPYLTVRELWATSVPEPDGSRRTRAPKIGWWWAAYLAAGLLSISLGGFSDQPSLDELRITSSIGLGGELISVWAAVLALSVIRDVVRGQSELHELFAGLPRQ